MLANLTCLQAAEPVFIRRVIAVSAVPANTYGEHATQTITIRDADYRSAVQADRRLLQINTNRHALHRECCEVRPKKPKAGTQTECVLSLAFLRKPGSAVTKNVRFLATDQLG